MAEWPMMALFSPRILLNPCECFFVRPLSPSTCLVSSSPDQCQLQCLSYLKKNPLSYGVFCLGKDLAMKDY